MTTPKFVAVRDGNDIIIKLPFDQIEEVIADAMPPEANPVTVRNVDRFLNGLVKVINGGNAIEELVVCEVGQLVDIGDRSVEEHVIRPRRVA